MSRCRRQVGRCGRQPVHDRVGDQEATEISGVNTSGCRLASVSAALSRGVADQLGGHGGAQRPVLAANLRWNRAASAGLQTLSLLVVGLRPAGRRRRSRTRLMMVAEYVGQFRARSPAAVRRRFWTGRSAAAESVPRCWRVGIGSGCGGSVQAVPPPGSLLQGSITCRMTLLERVVCLGSTAGLPGCGARGWVVVHEPTMRSGGSKNASFSGDIAVGCVLLDGAG